MVLDGLCLFVCFVFFPGVGRRGDENKMALDSYLASWPWSDPAFQTERERESGEQRGPESSQANF